MGPDLIPRFNGFPAAKINGGAGPGLQLGPGDRRHGGARRRGLPEGYGIAWSGQAYEEKQSGSASALVFVFGLDHGVPDPGGAVRVAGRCPAA